MGKGQRQAAFSADQDNGGGWTEKEGLLRELNEDWKGRDGKLVEVARATDEQRIRTWWEGGQDHQRRWDR